MAQTDLTKAQKQRLAKLETKTARLEEMVNELERSAILFMRSRKRN